MPAREQRPPGIIKEIDDHVRTWYTKKTVAYEAKGGDRYNLAQGLSLTAICAIPGFVASTGIAGRAIADAYFDMAFLTSAIDEYDSSMRREFGRTVTDGSGTTQYGLLDSIWKYTSEKTRLPLLVGGISAIGLGALTAIDGILHRDGGRLQGAVPYMIAGWQMLAIASSFYIKDIDPKLLEKEREEAPIGMLRTLEERLI